MRTGPSFLVVFPRAILSTIILRSWNLTVSRCSQSSLSCKSMNGHVEKQPFEPANCDSMLAWSIAHNRNRIVPFPRPRNHCNHGLSTRSSDRFLVRGEGCLRCLKKFLSCHVIRCLGDTTSVNMITLLYLCWVCHS